MGKGLSIGGLLIALGVGLFVYSKNLTTSGVTQAPPQQQIDVVAIRTSLLNIGQAERMYLAAHGTYGTLEQLRAESPAIPTDSRGYVFTVNVNGAQSFRATAMPADTSKPGWPTLEIDETMTVTQR